MQGDISGKFPELLQEGGALAVTHKVPEMPVALVLRAPPRHREDRRDADASGEEIMSRRRLGEREIVARRGCFDGIAGSQGAVQVERSATACCGEPDPHDIAIAFAPIVAKRIVPDHAVGQMQLDMGARRERWQRGTAGIAQLDRQRMLRFGNDIGDAKR